MEGWVLDAFFIFVSPYLNVSLYYLRYVLS